MQYSLEALTNSTTLRRHIPNSSCTSIVFSCISFLSAFMPSFTVVCFAEGVADVDYSMLLFVLKRMFCVFLFVVWQYVQ